MKILLAGFNSLTGLGGGQTAYRNLYSNRPELEITAVVNHKDLAGEFNNAKMVYPKDNILEFNVTQIKGDAIKLGIDTSAVNQFFAANRIAAAFAGEHFDIVDYPDFCDYARFIPSAFKYYGVSVGKYVLSLHGRVSTSLSFEDPAHAERSIVINDLRENEDETYLNSDIRYAISTTYRDELQSRLGSWPVQMVDPLCCIEQKLINGEYRKKLQGTASPYICLLGRLEKTKGADLFINLAWWLRNSPASTPKIIGEDIVTRTGSNMEKLKRSAADLSVDIDFIQAIRHDMILDYYRKEPMITVLPSNYDTFNLVALESLLCGNPLILSTNAGAYGYLKEKFGEDIVLPFNSNMPRNAEIALDMINNYQLWLDKIRNRLSEIELKPDTGSLIKAFAAPACHDTASRQKTDWTYATIHRIISFKNPDYKVNSGNLGINEKTFNSEFYCSFLQAFNQLREIFQLPELTQEQKELKIVLIQRYLEDNPYILKSRAFGELARLQADVEEDPFIVAAYDIRVMRWNGYDKHNRLGNVCGMLRSRNLSEEACVLEKMFGNTADNSSGIRDYLTNRYDSLKAPAHNVFEKTIDRRSKNSNVKISVIVSLYEAPAEQISNFYQYLSSFSSVKDRSAEVIFIDSGSPTHQWSAIEKMYEAQPCELLFCRTAERETIQQAWNRGIAESRGEYITFLGSDETMHPEALGLLCDCLEKNPSVNWAMGSAVTTDVNNEGRFVRTGLKYNRSALAKSDMLKDCCYLGYVGGLYRKGIHNDHGFYDPSFCGAGDTEFKNRIFPYLNIKEVEGCLGIFMDYPSDRVTASAKVEIEDLRAWYIFKTSGGVRYLLKNAAREEAEEAFLKALCKGRSFAAKPESDLFLALNILLFIRERWPESAYISLFDKLEEVCLSLRNILENEDFSAGSFDKIVCAYDKAVSFFSFLSGRFPDKQFPPDCFSDAVFFAHSWVWRNKNSVSMNKRVISSGLFIRKPFACCRFNNTGTANNSRLKSFMHNRSIYNILTHCDQTFLEEYFKYNDNFFHMQDTDMICRGIALTWKNLTLKSEMSGKGIAIYGAGKHTVWLLNALAHAKGPRIQCILDDAPRTETINGIPVTTPEKLDQGKIFAILISSDAYQAYLKNKASRFAGKDIEIVELYKDPVPDWDKPPQITV